MSVEALSIVLNHSRAKGASKLVLIGIANHLGPDAEEGAWPSQARLASYANVSDRAVRDAIDNLVKLGELRVAVAAGQSRSQYKPNRYWLTLKCPADCDRSYNHNRVEVFVEQSGTFEQTGWKPTSDKPLTNLKITKRDHELPEDWNPSQELLEMFKSKWPDIDPNYHIEQFKLYYWGKGTKHKNWSLAFQKWMGQEQQRAKAQPWRAGSVNSSSAQVKKETEKKHTDEFLQQMAELEKQAAPAPKCPHGNNIALCKSCLG
jgi:hypothetical protein